jgi:hypothetical protein
MFACLLLLLRKPSDSGASGGHGRAAELEDLLPVHSSYFPQIRQLLSVADAQFVRQWAHLVPVTTWKTERREVLRQYLAGLAQDFVRLDLLARHVAALSPDLDRAQELNRIWLSARFLVTYRFTALRLMAGGVPAAQFRRLTELVGSLAYRVDARITALTNAPC